MKSTFKLPRFGLIRRKIMDEEDEKDSAPSTLFLYFRSTFLFFYLLFAIDCLLPANETVCGSHLTTETGSSLSPRYSTNSGPILYACDRRLRVSPLAAHYLSGQTTIVGVSPILHLYKYARADGSISFVLFNFLSAVFFLTLTAILLLVSYKSDVVRMFIGGLGPALLALSTWLLYF